MSAPLIGARLLAAANFVRQGAYFADIGTDHAYLPLFLLSQGKISRAVCTDINLGPLNSARANAKAFSLDRKITFRHTDGAEGLENLGITDYAICGMGGELIADIISRAPFMKNDGVRLILQPMTKVNHLRRILAAEGFFTVAEEYSEEAGKHYVCIVSEYTGEKRTLTDVEAEFGENSTRVAISEAKRAYLLEKERSLSRTAEGKIKGGEVCPPELLLLDYLRKILGESENDG